MLLFSTLFLSSPQVSVKNQNKKEISIHAPRAGSDRDFITWRAERHISIHAPRAGSDYQIALDICEADISIHAPRAGSDAKRYVLPEGATDISIHAPRAGSDKRGHRRSAKIPYFNPRSPCGERQQKCTKRSCVSAKVYQFRRLTQDISSTNNAQQHHSLHFPCLKQVRTLRGNHVCLGFAARESGAPQGDSQPCSRSVRSSSRTACRGNRSAGCPALRP